MTKILLSGLSCFARARFSVGAGGPSSSVCGL